MQKIQPDESGCFQKPEDGTRVRFQIYCNDCGGYGAMAFSGPFNGAGHCYCPECRSRGPIFPAFWENSPESPWSPNFKYKLIGSVLVDDPEVPTGVAGD